MSDIKIALVTAGAREERAVTTGTKAWELFTDDPDVVYLESHVGALYLEEPAEVDEYRRIFELIRAGAIPVEDYR